MATQETVVMERDEECGGSDSSGSALYSDREASDQAVCRGPREKRMIAAAL